MTTPLLSIITPCHAPAYKYLPDAGNSIAQLREQAGYMIEWIIAPDGALPDDADFSDLADHKMLPAGKKMGSSAARNCALACSVGDYIFPLDADDVLEPAGVIEAVSHLQNSHNLNWVAGNRLAYPSGKHTWHWQDQPRRWQAGEYSQAWELPLPFHPNTIVFDRQAGLLAGSYPAVPVGEDWGFMLRLGRETTGLFLPLVMLHQRNHPEQTTMQPDYPDARRASQEVIVAFENVWRETCGLPPVELPYDPFLDVAQQSQIEVWRTEWLNQ